MSRPHPAFLLLQSRRAVYLLWVAMLLVHSPALVRDWGTLFSAGGREVVDAGFILLNLAAVLFVLKLFFVRGLEFGRDSRSMMSLAVSIALLHVHVDGDTGVLPNAPNETQVVASMLFAVSLVPVQRVLGRLVSSVKGRHCRPALLGMTQVEAQPIQSGRGCGWRAPRAPPA